MNIKNLSLNHLPRKARTFYAKAGGSCWLFWFTFFIFTSCASISPILSEERSVSNFPSLENVKPYWQSYAAGVDYFHGRTESPRLEFWALKIDLSAPNIEIVCSGNTVSATVSNFVRNNKLIAGINAVPFDTLGKNLGIVISGGNILSPAHPSYDALVFFNTDLTKNRTRAAILKQTSIKSAENIFNAIGGFYQILADGEAAQRTLGSEARHPRSAAGVSKDGETLYLLVIDGRRSGSAGGTERETAMILLSLGCWDGINFDGGGSSSLAMLFSDGSIKPVNTPIHNGIPGRERAVAGCLGIYINN
ncbi:MAG: phosphodiester glycosidase family protein [Treponema sp.]|nr:phosphodiester glycosidase family protein [Treponema sp.]